VTPRIIHQSRTCSRWRQKLAKDLGVHERGYRTIFNVNAEAGQTVFHLHLHVMGGRILNWP
jgi:histidine triad (HIT) family protein